MADDAVHRAQVNGATNQPKANRVTHIVKSDPCNARLFDGTGPFASNARYHGFPPRVGQENEGVRIGTGWTHHRNDGAGTLVQRHLTMSAPPRFEKIYIFRVDGFPRELHKVPPVAPLNLSDEFASHCPHSLLVATRAAFQKIRHQRVRMITFFLHFRQATRKLTG